MAIIGFEEIGDLAKIREFKLSQIPTSGKIHPGILLKQELQKRLINRYQAAELLNCTVELIDDIMNCKIDIWEEFAILLEEKFGISAKLLINIQKDWNGGE